jgi:hypothetical protein
MAFLGENVIVHDDASSKDLVGNVVGVDDHGFLILKEEDKEEETIIESGTLKKLYRRHHLLLKAIRILFFAEP